MIGTISNPVVVLGATGEVGRGVLRAALARGHAVVAVGRDAAQLQALRESHRGADLQTVRGSVAGDAEGAALADKLRRLGRPLEGVVAAVCGRDRRGRAGRGRLLDGPADFLRRRLDEDLLPHLSAARHLLPLLAENTRGGSYVLVGGPGSEFPWAAYGHRSIGAAALRMLARVLHDEARSLQVRVQLLSIDTPLCTKSNHAHACPDWPSPLAVGQRAIALLERRDDCPAQAVVRYAPHDPSVSPGAVDPVRPRAGAPTLHHVRALIDSFCKPEAGRNVDSRLPGST